ncbi:MAG: hypothetical protein ACKVHU_15085 [Acidimicrobiales bacterium]|jgi:hypothetical protein
MTSSVTIAVVAAMVLMGFGFQVLARRLRSSPVDVEAPTRLFEGKFVRPQLPPPVSLARTHQLVDDGVTSPMAAQRVLIPLLEELNRAQADDPNARLDLGVPGRDVRAWLDTALTELSRRA